MKAYLLFEDGTKFEGVACGASGCAIGEVVFNTGMAGYQEVLTDPSYLGQMVCMTYPLIGNYGINTEDSESQHPWVNGFIVRSLCKTPSNWRATSAVGDYLKTHGVVAIEGLDTRRLTRRLRECGVENGALYTEDQVIDEAALKEKIRAFRIKNAVETVSCKHGEVFDVPGDGPRVALLDFGAKRNIIRCLERRGCSVTVLPAKTKPEMILDGGFDGLMLSNGPGDPSENTEIIENLKVLIEKKFPIFGICLGHQLVALALGAQVEKLKYGHHGANHPVTDLKSGRTYITSQNHNYAVVAESVDPGVARVSHTNLNDGTVEGLELFHAPVFTVQFHPEGYPGPQDTKYLFDHFIANMKEVGVCR